MRWTALLLSLAVSAVALPRPERKSQPANVCLPPDEVLDLLLRLPESIEFCRELIDIPLRGTTTKVHSFIPPPATSTVTQTIHDRGPPIKTTKTVTQTIDSIIREHITDLQTQYFTAIQTNHLPVTVTDTQTSTITTVTTAFVSDPVTETVTVSLSSFTTDPVTETITNFATATLTDLATQTLTETYTNTITDYSTATVTDYITATATDSVTDTFTNLLTESVTNYHTETLTLSFTDTVTATETNTVPSTTTDAVEAVTFTTVPRVISETETDTVTNSVFTTDIDTTTVITTTVVTDGTTVTTTAVQTVAVAKRDDALTKREPPHVAAYPTPSPLRTIPAAALSTACSALRIPSVSTVLITKTLPQPTVCLQETLLLSTIYLTLNTDHDHCHYAPPAEWGKDGVHHETYHRLCDTLPHGRIDCFQYPYFNHRCAFDYYS